MEDQVDLPSQGDAESEGGSRDAFLDFKGTSLLHLEFLGSSPMQVCCFQLFPFSDLPWSELGCNPLLHLLLGYLVSSHSVIMGGREI